MTSDRKPDWIRSKMTVSENSRHISHILEKYGLYTVCQEAACPNKHQCWDQNDVTFLIMGDICTRNCHFCNVKDQKIPEKIDSKEPEKIATAVNALGIDYIVITSVTRDDLIDFGSSHFARTVFLIKKSKSISVEVLIPDFHAKEDLLQNVILSGPEVIGHNMETVERLYKTIRPSSCYYTTMKVLNILKKQSFHTAIKTSLMVGLGETEKEIFQAASHAKEAGVDIFYIGQYLQPSKKHVPVNRYYSPKEFQELAVQINALGFTAVLAAPMVRSSFKAKESYLQHINK
jgi:lipoic acid synthetase